MTFKTVATLLNCDRTNKIFSTKMLLLLYCAGDRTKNILYQNAIAFILC
ncbi:hypothetical protein [Calothrix sp. NIES-2100]